MVTIQSLIDSSATPEPLKRAAQNISNRNIRNIATVGGNIGSNKVCGDLLPLLIVLKAQVKVVDVENKYMMKRDADYLEKEDNELIIGIEISKKVQERHLGFTKYSRTTNDLSLVATAVSFLREGERLTDPIIAIGGLTRHVRSYPDIAAFFADKSLPKESEIMDFVKDNLESISDFQGDATFRKHLVGAQLSDIVLSAYSSETKGW